MELMHADYCTSKGEGGRERNGTMRFQRAVRRGEGAFPQDGITEAGACLR
jgi:hypothetical protein